MPSPNLVQAPAHKAQLGEDCQQGGPPHHSIHSLEGLEVQELVVRLHKAHARQALRCRRLVQHSPAGGAVGVCCRLTQQV